MLRPRELNQAFECTGMYACILLVTYRDHACMQGQESQQMDAHIDCLDQTGEHDTSQGESLARLGDVGCVVPGSETLRRLEVAPTEPEDTDVTGRCNTR